MKYTTCLSLFSLLSLTASLVAPVHAQSNNGHSLVSSSFNRKLKSLGIKVALPKYVPQGFRVVTVSTKPCRQGDRIDANGVCRFGPDYTVLYRNDQDQCFAVEATGGGIGGPTGRYSRTVNTRLLGKVDVNIGNGMGEPITEAIAKTPQELWSFPAGKSPFYSLRTINSQAANRINSTITCNDTAYMTPNEFIKIVQSLDWLR